MVRIEDVSTEGAEDTPPGLHRRRVGDGDHEEEGNEVATQDGDGEVVEVRPFGIIFKIFSKVTLWGN